MDDLGRPEVLVAIGGAACFLVLVVGLGSLLGGFRLLRRLATPDPEALPKALARIGYLRTAERWTRSADGVPVSFDEPGGGWRWTARLPRYQAITLRIEERGSEWPPVAREGAILAGDPEIDVRFRFLTERSAPALALLATEGVAEALLALPFVDLDVRGDEVVLRDPTRAGLPGRASVEAQVRLHLEVGALMVALARYRG